MRALLTCCCRSRPTRPPARLHNGVKPRFVLDQNDIHHARWEASANASNKGVMSKTPYFAGLKTHVFPIKSVGNKTQNVSFNG